MNILKQCVDKLKNRYVFFIINIIVGYILIVTDVLTFPFIIIVSIYLVLNIISLYWFNAIMHFIAKCDLVKYIKSPNRGTDVALGMSLMIALFHNYSAVSSKVSILTALIMILSLGMMLITHIRISRIIKS